MGRRFFACVVSSEVRLAYIGRMARGDTYSRMVLWLKVTLPLVALAILSTLFLVAETLDPEAAIPYADVDVDRILEDQGVTRPAFGGLSSDGVAVSLGAESVRPDGTAFVGRDLELKMVFPQGSTIDMASPEGIIDMAAESAELSGGVRLASTAGYDIETDQINAGWSEAKIETTGAVTANGPTGRLEAGRMILTRDQTDATHLLVFKDGVRLVYDPKS